jgi:hypothetical protein
MATVEQTMMRVQRIMTGPMGLKVMVAGDSFRATFENVSTHLRIRVIDWGKDKEGQPRTLVLLTAPILSNVPATPELFEWVARHGGSRWFGHVEVHAHDGGEAGQVSLVHSHTLLGDFIDQPELEVAMWAVLGAADQWDDELRAKFGGTRWSDD